MPHHPHIVISVPSVIGCSAADCSTLAFDNCDKCGDAKIDGKADCSSCRQSFVMNEGNTACLGERFKGLVCPQGRQHGLSW